jgi:hypothetical protein
MKRFKVYCRYTAKPAGGLFLGFKLHFPGEVWYADDDVRTTWFLALGLLIFTVTIEYYRKSNKKEME